MEVGKSTADQRSSKTAAEQIVQADINTITTTPAPYHKLRRLAAL